MILCVRLMGRVPVSKFASFVTDEVGVWGAVLVKDGRFFVWGLHFVSVVSR